MSRRNQTSAPGPKRTGHAPIGTVPAGNVPTGNVPTGIAPTGNVPSGHAPSAARPPLAAPVGHTPGIPPEPRLDAPPALPRPADRTPACAVADMLLAPVFLCHRARCRRHRGCSLPGTTEPDPQIPLMQPETCFPRCIAEANAAIQEEFLLILGILLHIEKTLEPGVLETWNGNTGTDPDTDTDTDTDTDPDADVTRAHIHAALTLAARRLPKGDPLLAEFRAFWRREGEE